MSNIATTIEQSKRLLELGLSKETADMSYSEEYFGKDKDGNDEWCWRLNACKFVDVEGIIPAWSLSELLEVMPKEHEPEIQKSPVTGQYFVYGFFDGEKPTYMTKDYDSPIDAAYEMVCWLLEQGLIKKGGKDGRD